MAARTTKVFPETPPRFTARLRWGRIAPRKLRRVADLIRGRTYTEARAILRHTHQRGAYFTLKLLDSAFANAAEEIRRRRLDIDPDELEVAQVRVDGGLTLKRIRPATRRPTIVRKRTSHMFVALEPPPPRPEPAPRPARTARERPAPTSSGPSGPAGSEREKRPSKAEKS